MKRFSMNVKRTISFCLSVLMLLNLSVFVSAQTAKLAAKMYWTTDVEASVWNDAQTAAAMFDCADFEPGSEAVRYIKVENTGKRALSYALSFSSEAEAGELADVIDVYKMDAVSGNVTVDQMSLIGTLAEVINSTAFSDGDILPGTLSDDGFYSGSTVVAVALKMKDDASIDYANKTVDNFSVKLTAVECAYDNYPSVDKFEIAFPNTDKYIYRVGNANTVKLGSLFSAIKGADIGNVTVQIEKLDPVATVSGTYTSASDWKNIEIQFTGTGPVKVTIDDDDFANALSLDLEVVDATNVTSYGELKNRNSVLLNDITMSDDSDYYISDATLYGNGFTFDVTKGKTSGTGQISNNYLVGVSNAKLDNIKIVGKVYTQYGGKAADEYNRPVVLSVGNNTITNSYISNCASPVRIKDGNLEIVNTTLKGGNFANLDIRGGNVVLDNVTTINQVKGNDLAEDGTVVAGFGVVVFYENVPVETKVEVKNGITQYNNLSKSQAETYIKDEKAKILTTVMYSSKCSNIQYTDASGDIWVNSGILSMTSNVGDSNISDVSGYSSATPDLLSVTGYVHAKVPTAEDVTAEVPEYESVTQYAIAPAYSFEYPVEGKKNYIAMTEGSNKWCYYDSGVIRISFDNGDYVSFDPSILTVTKQGQSLPYTVTMNGTDYTNKTITFNSSGDYQLVYTYSDDNNYIVNENGEIQKYTVTYTKNINIASSAVMPKAKNAEFDFNGNGSKSVVAGSNTYIMPNVTATSASIGSKTVSGQTIYYPIVEIIMSDGKTSHTSGWNAYFPVLKGAVTITDYAEEGTGDAVTYGGSTTTMPGGLAIVGDPATLFKYQSSSSAGSSPVVKNNVLVYSSPKIEAKRSEYNTVVEYIYTDEKGSVYHYYVGYHAPAQSYSSLCVTGDTLVTLADGSQKRIDEVTYEDKLLVWDFYNGEYAESSPAIIFDHGYGDNKVIKLTFDDGTEVKIVNGHQFFDVGANEFVTISDDNAESLIGREFLKTDGNDYSSVKLSCCEINEENCRSYGVISAFHYNAIVEDLLTTNFEQEDCGLYYYFDVGENMTYDKEQMEADIEKYGLYTYEDFDGYITPEFFDAYNVKYMKISVGKGQYTHQGIFDLIQRWLVESDDVVPATSDGGISALSEDGEITIVIDGNKVSSAGYAIGVSVEGATEADGVYTLTGENCVVTLTATGTATTGYATISVDGDMYYTANIASGESLAINVKNVQNAKDKTLTVAYDWGTSDADEVLENGAEIDFGVFAIKSIDGASVTLSNTTKYSVTGDVYIAVYSDNKCIYVGKSANVTVEGKNEYTFSPEYVVPENATVKAFVWEAGTMTPIL